MTQTRITRQECCRRIAEHVRTGDWEEEFSPVFPIVSSSVFTKYLRGCEVVHNSKHLGKPFPYFWGHLTVGWAAYNRETGEVTLANLPPATSEDDTRRRSALRLRADELRALVMNGRVAVYDRRTADERYITLTEPKRAATPEAFKRCLRRDISKDSKTLRACLV